MLFGTSTKYGAGITLSGDIYDFSDLKKTIDFFTSENSLLPEKQSEFLLELSYDLKHANQGDRRSIVLGRPDFEIHYNEFDILWPDFLVKLAILRSIAAYMPTEKIHQANLYRLESCAQSALEEVDLNVAKQCMQWLAQFPPLGASFLLQFVTYACLDYVTNEKTEKKRIRSLPEVLFRISPYSKEYAAFAESMRTIAIEKNCNPNELRDSADWPEFTW